MYCSVCVRSRACVVCVRACVRTYVCVWASAGAGAYVRACACACVCVRVRVRVYVGACTYSVCVGVLRFFLHVPV